MAVGEITIENDNKKQPALVVGNPSLKVYNKALPWQQSLGHTYQELMSSRSFCGSDSLKVLLKSAHGFSLWSLHKVYTINLLILAAI